MIVVAAAAAATKLVRADKVRICRYMMKTIVKVKGGMVDIESSL